MWERRGNEMLQRGGKGETGFFLPENNEKQVETGKNSCLS